MFSAPFSFSEPAHHEFLLRPRLDLQPIRRPLSRPVNACFSFRDDSFETFLFRKLKEVFATSFDVAADLDASYPSNNLLQALPPKTGIYGYLLGGIGYALFGSSRHLAIGPTSAISLMVGVSVGILSALFHRVLEKPTEGCAGSNRVGGNSRADQLSRNRPPMAGKPSGVHGCGDSIDWCPPARHLERSSRCRYRIDPAAPATRGAPAHRFLGAYPWYSPLLGSRPPLR
jgi:Sulfate permease family